jgi:hypothetical protein
MTIYEDNEVAIIQQIRKGKKEYPLIITSNHSQTQWDKINLIIAYKLIKPIQIKIK